MVGPLVPCWNDQHHVIVHERLDMNIFALLRPFDQGEVNLVCKKRFKDLVGVAAAGRNPYPRLVPQEVGHETGKQILRNGLGSTKCEFPCLMAICRSYRGGCFLAQRLHLVRKRQQGLARGRRRNAPSPAVEQRRAELFFKRLDLLCYSGLREKKLLSSPSEIQVMGNSAEHPKTEVLQHQRTTTSMPNVWWMTYVPKRLSWCSGCVLPAVSVARDFRMYVPFS